MSIATTESALWSLALSGQSIDPSALADALRDEAARGQGEPMDFRTRLLIRDSLDALARHWGAERIDRWLVSTSSGPALREIWRSALGEAGFPSLTERLMETTRPDTVMQFLRELGLRCPTPARLEIGGAIAVILAGILSRHTEDVDVVDEVPAVLRPQHDLLQELASRYGLHLTHFQSHCLPAGWRDRLPPLDQFGSLQVLLIDACDVFVGKLFSARIKDRDDLRAMAPRLDKNAIEERFIQSAGALMAQPSLARQAAENWFIVFGTPLPAGA